MTEQLWQCIPPDSALVLYFGCGDGSRAEALRQRKAKIEKQLADLEARERTKARKEETRLKVLIGAGLLADAKIHPDIVENIKKILDRATTSKRDRDFLQAKGWIKTAP